jgi:methionyl-tRNA formyltransferase
MAVAPLRALHDAGFEIPLVVTGADKRRGRRGAAAPSPVKVEALSLGLAVSHDVDDLPAVAPELGVVVAYGHLLRRPLLEQVPMVNLHFSLLPRWRGAAPVERALLAGDDTTGVCLMAVEEGLDTGAVYARREIAVRRTSTAAELREQLVVLGSGLLVDQLRGGLGVPEPQQGEPTYASKLTTADLELRWDRPAEELDRVVRVGGAWTTFRGKRLKVGAATIDGSRELVPGELREGVVGTGSGALRLLSVQPEGRAPQPYAAWANGARPVDGERLGDPR